MGSITWSGNASFDTALTAGSSGNTGTLLTIPSGTLNPGDTHLALMGAFAFGSPDTAEDLYNLGGLQPHPTGVRAVPNTGSPASFLANGGGYDQFPITTLSGTVSISGAPSSLILGVGTHFTTEVGAGVVRINIGTEHSYSSAGVVNDTTMVVQRAFQNNYSGVVATKGGLFDAFGGQVTQIYSPNNFSFPTSDLNSGAALSIALSDPFSSLTVRGCLVALVYSYTPLGTNPSFFPTVGFDDAFTNTGGGTSTGTSNLTLVAPFPGTTAALDAAFWLAADNKFTHIAAGILQETGFGAAPASPHVNAGSESLWTHVEGTTHASTWAAIGYMTGTPSNLAAVPWSLTSEVETGETAGSLWELRTLRSAVATARPLGHAIFIGA